MKSPPPSVVAMALAAALASVGCSSSPEASNTSKASPKPVVTRAELEARTPSQRIIGEWTMRLADLGEGSLNDDLRALRDQGLEDKVSIDYEFTDSEFILRKRGAGGPFERRWTYEILKEGEDTLMLERMGPDGDSQRILALVKADTLELGRDNDRVLLHRKNMP